MAKFVTLAALLLSILLSGCVSSEQLDGDGKWVGRAVQRPRKAKCFGPKMEVSIDRGLMKGTVSEFGFGVPTIELKGNLDSRGALNATGDEFGLNGMLHRGQDVIVGTWHFATLECKGTFTLERPQPASKSSGTRRII